MQDQKEKKAVKSDNAFRTISEVSEGLGIPQHVLRFWEVQFSQVRPVKRGGGRRYYRPEDVVLLERIRSCLYDDGYTIRGVQKLLREGAGPEKNGVVLGQSSIPEDSHSTGLSVEQRQEVEAVLVELEDIRAVLGTFEFA